MSSAETRSLRMLGVGLVLMVFIVILGLVGKFVVMPFIQKTRVSATSSASRYEESVTLCLDSFAGYAVLRSPRFMQRLGDEHQLGLNIVDDKADYEGRAKALRAGDCDVAVMTIDADLVTGESLGEFPGSIVLVLDETHGADGVVSFKDAIPNVSALNQPDARIVATPDSPSETLARHMKSGMLPQVTSKSWLIKANGAKDVLEQIKDADRALPRAYVLWEPELSRALALDGTVLIYSSTDTTGVIVDVLVFGRQYLKSHPDKARAIVATYLQTLRSFESESDGMVKLLIEDGKQTGEKISEKDAQRMGETIVWRTTLENYAHFGLLPRYEAKGLQSMDTMINGIAAMLVRTGKLERHPAEGRTHELYYDALLRQLQAEGFHPDGNNPNAIRGQSELPVLDEAQWGQLVVVGNLDATSISFKRASADLSVQGERDVDEIARQLRSYPNYYITVIGNSRAEGDPEANRLLALERAHAVEQRLIFVGVSKNRVRSIAAEAKLSNGEGQSVTFELSQSSY